MKEDNFEKIHKIESFLNSNKLQNFRERPDVGTLIAAKIKNTMKYYRAVVESYYQLNNKVVAKIFFIDHGSTETVCLSDMYWIPPNNEICSIPGLAFQCRLAGIELDSNKGDDWCPEAIQLCKKYGSNPYDVYGTVYSVVDSVVAIHMTCVNNKVKPTDNVNLNGLLVDKRLAKQCEESYLSNYNHNLREHSIQEPKQKKYIEYSQYNKKYLINSYPEPPSIDECRSEIVLSGPRSPLEVNLTSLANNASNRKVTIENSSVNSILLDTDPEDPHERLLVSNVVGQSQRGSVLTLRNTTLLPNIKGLTSLICMMFAPKIELRRSSRGTCYVGALCGLGAEKKTKQPMLPEHDLEVYFDTDFNLNTLADVSFTCSSSYIIFDLFLYYWNILNMYIYILKLKFKFYLYILI